MLGEGEWDLAGSELIINVPKSPTVVEMALGPEPKRLLAAAVTEAAGKVWNTTPFRTTLSFF